MFLIEEKDDRFKIGLSTQPKAGRGLFALKDIKKGDYIEVLGVIVEKGSPADLCTQYAESYKFAADYKESYTGHVIPMGYAALVNHANDRSQQNVEIKYINKDGRPLCVYMFTRDVVAGVEILGDYGEDWNLMTEWSRKTNESSDQSEEDEWMSFLNLGLYKLDLLKKIGEEYA